jgi:hypothetical protein
MKSLCTIQLIKIKKIKNSAKIQKTKFLAEYMPGIPATQR